MDRRTFLGAGAGAGAAAVASLLLPKAALAQTCTDVTAMDNYGIGPFYLPDAPSRIKLASAFEPGQRISISGLITDCSGPLQAVGLDLWHATQSGCYQHPNDNCPDIPGHAETFRLRGKLATDAAGRYSFESILPGAYLNGSKYRPQHIHAIITHPSLDQEIITQLYFQGDPYIPGDFGADAANAANRIIPLVKTDPALWTGVWNIRLPGNISGVSPYGDPALRGFDVVVWKRDGFFLIHLPSLQPGQTVELRLFRPDGSLLRRDLHSLRGDEPLRVDAARLPGPGGACLAEMRWLTRSGLHTESVFLRT